MGISRDSMHKRRKSGAKRVAYHKKKKYHMGRQPSNTRLGIKRIHTVRCRAGIRKFRALALDQGNFSWPSHGISRKTRLLNVVYNASNNDYVRTNTLVRNAVIEIDAIPFKLWYMKRFGVEPGKKMRFKLDPKEGDIPAEDQKKTIALKKKQSKYEEEKKKAEKLLHQQYTEAQEDIKKRSENLMKKHERRLQSVKLDPLLEEQFSRGRLLACITSRPGQVGRCDGYILEGKELEFYLKKVEKKKSKK
jgi:small subunit ribosomal protein S8e